MNVIKNGGGGEVGVKGGTHHKKQQSKTKPEENYDSLTSSKPPYMTSWVGEWQWSCVPRASVVDSFLPFLSTFCGPKWLRQLQQRCFI